MIEWPRPVCHGYEKAKDTAVNCNNAPAVSTGLIQHRPSSCTDRFEGVLSEGERMKARDAKYEAKVHEEEREAQEEQPVPI